MLHAVYVTQHVPDVGQYKNLKYCDAINADQAHPRCQSYRKLS